jgi:hypothetical protein
MLKRRARTIGTTRVRNANAVSAAKQYRIITTVIHNIQKQLNNLLPYITAKNLWREIGYKAGIIFSIFFKKAFFKAFLVLRPERYLSL